MSIVSVESNRFEMMEKVAELFIQGEKATDIAKKLNIPRKQVIELENDYRAALANDNEARDLARDHLNQMVKHFDSLMKKTYDLMEELDALAFSHNVAAQKNAAIKLAADLDAKRVDALQKAGLLDSAELGDELAEAEEKQEMILDILRNDLCSECKRKVAYKLSQISGRAEVIEAEVVK